MQVLFKHFGYPPGRSPGSGLLFNGLLCVLFSVAIFANPDLLALLIAVFLMVLGVSLLVTWWRIRHWR